MSTHITTHNPVRSDVSSADGTAAVTVRRSRGWAVAGIVSGIAGLGTMVSAGMVNAVYDPDLVHDTSKVADKLYDQTGPMLAFHLFALVGAVAMVVFAAGLQRRLRDRIGDGLAATVAFAGTVGTAVVIVLGSGLDTEFYWAFQEDEKIVDDANAALYNHWIGTIPWVWVLAGLTGLALFSAFRSGAVPRWIGLVGLVLGGLTLLLGISPLQYMAGMTGPLWLLVTAIGFAVGDRAYRRGE
ncbi:MAG: DUF4386 family protein [Actinomycetota bacterium]|nr:DUF4386 family protein [Actinomycetota bacterium]